MNNFDAQGRSFFVDAQERVFPVDWRLCYLPAALKNTLVKSRFNIGSICIAPVRDSIYCTERQKSPAPTARAWNS